MAAFQSRSLLLRCQHLLIIHTLITGSELKAVWHWHHLHYCRHHHHLQSVDLVSDFRISTVRWQKRFKATDLRFTLTNVPRGAANGLHGQWWDVSMVTALDQWHHAVMETDTYKVSSHSRDLSDHVTADFLLRRVECDLEAAIFVCMSLPVWGGGVFHTDVKDKLSLIIKESLLFCVSLYHLSRFKISFICRTATNTHTEKRQSEMQGWNKIRNNNKSRI